MKYLLWVLISTQLLLACNDSKPKKKSEKVIELSEEEILQSKINSIEKSLRCEYDKISLLAEFYNIPFDSVISIIRDYKVFTSSFYNKEETLANKYKSSISKLSLIYKISRSKLASLIIDYKYKMISEDEIRESAVEDFIEHYDDDHNDSEIPDQRDYY